MKKTFFVMFVFFSTLILAEEVDSLLTSKSRYYELEGIRVVAEKPQQSIGSIEVKKFNSQNAMTEINLAESVADMNGVDLTIGGKGESNLRIRGFDKKEIKIMIDGRPLSSGYFGNLDLQLLPLSDIDQIQLIKGPVSALYGFNTMGGVLNLITKKPGNKSWIKLTTQFRRNNTNSISLSSSRELEKFSYWLFASRNNTDGFMLPEELKPVNSEAELVENGNVRDNSDREQYDFQMKLNWKIFDFHKFGITAGYTFMDEKGNPASIYQSTDENYSRIFDWKRYQLTGISSFQLRYNLKSASSIYFDSYEDTYKRFADNTYSEITLNSLIENWTFGFSQNFEWQPFDVLKILSGYRGEKQVYNRKDDQTYLDWTSNNQHLHHTFVQNELSVWKNITITAGSGISFFTQKHREKAISNFEPVLGLYFDDHKTSFSAAFSRNTKYPTMQQLFSSSSGNPDLEPELADKYEISLKIPFIIKNIPGSFSNSYFYNDVNNLISKKTSYINVERFITYGSEFSFDLNPFSFWMQQLDLCLLRIDEEKSDKILYEEPENSLKIREKFKITKWLNFIYEAEWKDKYLSLDRNDNEFEIPSRWLHSIKFFYNWKRTKISLGVENVFDKYYEEEYGYPGEGINFFISTETELF